MTPKELTKLYKEIKPQINERISEFEDVGKSSGKRIFKELAFCICTPQSKAQNAWKAITILDKSGDLFNADANQIAETLNIVRFKNNKAKYIVEARNNILKNNIFVKNSFFFKLDAVEKREWLVINIKGIAYKEASHFLRNIGFGDDYAILDRHILRNLVHFGVIEEMPKTITKAKYYELEIVMKKFAKEIKIPLQELDMVFWYRVNNEIYK